MKICLMLLVIALAGCTQHTAKPEPTYRAEHRLSPAVRYAVMELLYMKADPNIFKAKEIDPFRRQ